MHAGIAFIRRIVWHHDREAPYHGDVREAIVRCSLLAILAFFGIPLLGTATSLLVVTAELQEFDLSGVDGVEHRQGSDGIMRRDMRVLIRVRGDIGSVVKLSSRLAGPRCSGGDEEPVMNVRSANGLAVPASAFAVDFPTGELLVHFAGPLEAI